MRPTARVNVLTRPRVSRLVFVCLHCRNSAHDLPQRAHLSTSSSRNLQRSDSTLLGKVSLQEKFRRKIWGTETPPGQEDPYRNESLLHQTNRRGRVEADIGATTEAAVLSQGAINQTEYVPATTWDGLEHIGGPTGWWEEAWDQDHQFRGFMSAITIESPEDIKKLLHRAIAEVFTLLEAGRPLNDATNAIGDRIIADFSKVTFSELEGGSVALHFSAEQVRQDILASTAQSKPVQEVLGAGTESEAYQLPGDTDLESVEATPVKDILDEKRADDQSTINDSFEPAIVDQSWLNISFRDSGVKFAILKRVMQLIGRRIPDPAISEINSVKNLLGHLVKKPKPKKLAEALLNNDKLIAIPNVQLFDRRYTPIDREKEVGRWKVIERELEKRGLPVTGHA